MGEAMRVTGRMVVAAAALWSSVSDARVVANVELAETVQVEGRELRLRRAALKEKLWFDVFVWGLYMEADPRTTQEALSKPCAKRLHITLKRNLRREQLVENIRSTLGTASSMQSPEMKAGLEQFIGALRDVRKGEDLLITYVPGQGTYVTGQVREDAFIAGKPFADALFAAWLERNPL
ncbi:MULTISPECIES: chalcone isomerase family protein [Myxococcaceae]|uniref:chalcone isomerase family protein n=1 Tax=Myxococcaceae TaxID=31 RepID=UPI00188FB293|nr:MULTISPECIES: chalcone isomerase family protein [Myxococcaceae]MBF5043040.1 chalcone isomerase family protein [Simulacricoccus sp. 17bor-14]